MPQTATPDGSLEIDIDPAKLDEPDTLDMTTAPPEPQASSPTSEAAAVPSDEDEPAEAPAEEKEEKVEEKPAEAAGNPADANSPVSPDRLAAFEKWEKDQAEAARKAALDAQADREIAEATSLAELEAFQKKIDDGTFDSYADTAGLAKATIGALKAVKNRTEQNAEFVRAQEESVRVAEHNKKFWSDWQAQNKAASAAKAQEMYETELAAATKKYGPQAAPAVAMDRVNNSLDKLVAVAKPAAPVTPPIVVPPKPKPAITPGGGAVAPAATRAPAKVPQSVSEQIKSGAFGSLKGSIFGD